MFLFSYSQSTTFAIIGDYGVDNDHEADVATMVDSWGPNFILTVGDNFYADVVNNYHDAIAKYYHKYMYPHDSQYGQNDTSTTNFFWPTVGDHAWDANINDYTNYFHYLPNNQRYYTIKIGDIEIFSIDSDQRQSGGTGVDSPEGQWMIPKIQSSSAKWKIVLYHHPTYTSSNLTGSYPNYITWPFEEYGVDAVLSGHAHVYERILKDNNNDGKDLVYFTNGLGGRNKHGFAQPYDTGSLFRYNSDWGAIKVIEKDDSLRFEFHSVASGYPLIDSYTIDKSTPTPVELVTFNAKVVQPSSVKLYWNTATEINNYGFDIQRSAGKNVWDTIAFVKGNGNSNSPKNYFYIDNYLLAGNYDYRLKQIDNDGSFKYSKIISISIGLPDVITLYQNYPNPFNPTTKIRFGLNTRSVVSLKIHNILGEHVKTLIDNVEKNAGEHNIDFNAKDLAGGIYMCVLRAGNTVITKKMILLK